VARRLEADDQLPAAEAALVPGFAAAFGAPDGVPPRASVVAGVPTAGLATLRRP
jgi:hypothetical protein